MKKSGKWSYSVLAVLSSGLLLQASCVDTLVLRLTEAVGAELLESLLASVVLP